MLFQQPDIFKNLHKFTLVFVHMYLLYLFPIPVAGWVWFVLFLGLSLCAAVSKETGLTAVALALVWEVFLLRRVSVCVSE